MDYLECLAYLERLGNEVLTMRFGLGPFSNLLKTLDNPHKRYPSVLIAGTNGKGSVARFLGSILSSCGLRTGIFTSPHVLRLEERLALDGRIVQPEEFASCFSQVAEAIWATKSSLHPTYFETVTATAFQYFSRQQVDIAILEVGMGGRLDSTNVVNPQLSLITRIGLDHQAQLGETIGQIAAEKAGVLRSGTPVLISPQTDEVRQVLGDTAGRLGAHLHDLDFRGINLLNGHLGKYEFSFQRMKFQLGVCGQHQVENAAMAVQASQILSTQGFSTDEEGIVTGVESVRSLGVLQKIQGDPVVFLDGGHNRDAVANLVKFLEEHTLPPRSLVFGITQDKDIDVVLQILAPLFDKIYLTRFQSARASEPLQIQVFCPQGEIELDPRRALAKALARKATTVVAGSFYLVGEVLPGLEAEHVSQSLSRPARKVGHPS